MKRRLSPLSCRVELVGVLTREIPTRLVEISRSGCLLESAHRIEEGTVATLRLEVQGQTYTEDVRATRCVAVAGSGSSYLVGIEFLHTSSPDGMSIRRAMAGSLSAHGDLSQSLPGPSPI
jgi:hypothetical protein